MAAELLLPFVGLAKPAVVVGARFGRLTVLGAALSRQNGRYFFVRCDCGTKKEVMRVPLLTGDMLSCGCLWLERVTKHGLTKHPIYRAWKSMRARCNNPNVREYRRYGARGIRVCGRWETRFENFRDDMLPSWQPGLEIDRIDNNGNYEPGNCRWTTRQQQAWNMRTNVRVASPWGYVCLGEASERSGIPRSTVWHRHRRGLPLFG